MFYSKLQNKLERSCGSCAMCCSGHFGLICNGEIIQSEGRPCKYLSSSYSCTIYSNRPECCKIFMCLYRQDNSVPEWIKPNVSQVIMSERNAGNLGYLEVVNCGLKFFPDDLLEWIYNRHLEKKQNVVIIHNNLYYILAIDNSSYNLLYDFQSKKYNSKVQNAYELPFFSKYIDNNNVTDKI